VQDIGSAFDMDQRLLIRGITLTQRILLVNVIPLLMLAGSFFYLDAIRARLIEERMQQATIETDFAAFAIMQSAPANVQAVMTTLAAKTQSRYRIVIEKDQIAADTWQPGPATFTFSNPDEEPWQKQVATKIDEAIDLIVGADPLAAFDDFALSPDQRTDSQSIRLAPDRTHMITVTRSLRPQFNGVLINDKNVRDIRKLVRAERSRLAYIILAATFVSVLLSLFMARTIASPLILLANAARQVRLGRARDVSVPRLPDRQDEIGLVARSMADMNQALQNRIDTIDAFAADVAHELKNPLASMGSAVETLQAVKNKKLQTQLLAIIKSDIVRMDRLITDISELSRIDAQLARTDYGQVDMGQLIDNAIADFTHRGLAKSVKIAFARPKRGVAVVRGDANRLLRVLNNLIDNAISFSPEGGVVKLSASKAERVVIISVEDNGPGITPGSEDAIFERFHSDRPDQDSFGKFSGLGLSIAKTIVTAHNGTLVAKQKKSGTGGWFIVTLPSWS
jgi:two-component system, OmpR family, sensor histidine kinase ChvG